MSHIARFNLVVDNEQRLRNALGTITDEVTEGYFVTPYAFYNRGTATIEDGNKVTAWNRMPIAFGARIGRSGRQNYIGFARANDGLEMVGDDYATGMTPDQIATIVENAYVNAAVTEVVPQLQALGFVEESEPLQLQQLVA